MIVCVANPKNRLSPLMGIAVSVGSRDHSRGGNLLLNDEICVLLTLCYSKVCIMTRGGAGPFRIWTLHVQCRGWNWNGIRPMEIPA